MDTGHYGLHYYYCFVMSQAGDNYWLVVDKHKTDFTGTKCNKIGATFKALHAMNERCYRKEYT